ncbi:MAG: ATP-binding protein [Bacillota bacterium]
MMRELSLHVLDLAQNAVEAGATALEVRISEDRGTDTLTITVTDNGRGMSAELAACATDAFTTTRTTRRVGLGLPFLAAAAEACGGGVTVESSPGAGTTIRAKFQLSHIDRAPLGDMAGTIAVILAANPGLRLTYVQSRDALVLRSEFDGCLTPAEALAVRERLAGWPAEQPGGVGDEDACGTEGAQGAC